VRRTLRRFEPPLEILGVYHSHPRGPAVPSSTDVAEAYYPEWLYVIVGLQGARVHVGVWRASRGASASRLLSRSGSRPR
jgi:proteasome lid subunit RPN8/RPN11